MNIAVLRRSVYLSAAVVLVAASGAVLAGIRGTPHDFSGHAWSGGKVCLPCHTSHQSSKEGYFWNHSYPPDSELIKRDGATLGFESLICLGCHDGQTALDSFGGAVGSTVMTGSAVVGRDLSGDHPVGIAYPTSGRDLKTPSAVSADLALFDGRIECSSCHDPHNNTYNKFLRVSSRQLCQTCHDV